MLNVPRSDSAGCNGNPAGPGSVGFSVRADAGQYWRGGPKAGLLRNGPG